jgi:hypothetical protein
VRQKGPSWGGAAAEWRGAAREVRHGRGGSGRCARSQGRRGGSRAGKADEGRAAGGCEGGQTRLEEGRLAVAVGGGWPDARLGAAGAQSTRGWRWRLGGEREET